MLVAREVDFAGRFAVRVLKDRFETLGLGVGVVLGPVGVEGDLERGVVEADEEGVGVVEGGWVGVAGAGAGGEEEDVVGADVSVKGGLEGVWGEEGDCGERGGCKPMNPPSGVHQMDTVKELLGDFEPRSQWDALGFSLQDEIP